MIQDRFHFRDTPSAGGTARLESDRDCLPFPVGGVFGPISHEDPAPMNDDWDRMDTISVIENVLDRMQGQLDELEEGVEDVIAHIGQDGGWRPSAA